jgi:hypothetical protein
LVRGRSGSAGLMVSIGHERNQSSIL